MQQFQDGQTYTDPNGTTYVRSGGQWHAQAPAIGQAIGQSPYAAPQAAANLQQTQQSISNSQTQQANTRTNIAQGQQQIQLTPPKAAGDFIKDFNADPAVKSYREALPVIIAATQAGKNGAGDASVVYGWAKTMDPTGSVREGDVNLAQSTSGPMQQAQFLISKYHLENGGTLPPDVRHNLIEEMRTKGRQLDLQYSDKYRQYQQLLQQSGINPSILGPHEGDKYRNAEEAYVRSVNGNKIGPTDPSYPGAKPPPQAGDIGFDTPAKDPRGDPFNAQQAAAYDAWIKANPNATPDQLRTFGKSLGADIQNADDILKALKAGQGAQPGSSAIFAKPDISDVRGQNGATEKADALVRGAGDAMSLGLADKAAALQDTILNGGTFDQNLARQYAISDYDQKNHFGLRFGGQALGGALLPLGEVDSVGNLAAKGAGYGAAYGFGSSRSVSDIPGSVAFGTVAGGGIPLALGGAGKGIAALRGARAGQNIPPLVDPTTGALNEPLEAMSPGQRMVAAKDFGIDLPWDAAGGRTAAQLGKGLDILPASAGVMEDARRGTEGQVKNAVDQLANQFGSSRTLNEAGSQLQQGALARNERAASVIGKAYDAIPISPNAPASKTSTIATLQQLTGRFQSNPDLAASMKDPKLAGYLDALQNGDISWKDLKDFRSIIGEKIGDMRFGEGQSTSDLRALYAGLSEDMRNTAAAQGKGALRAFERANTLNRQNEELIQNSLTRILGKDGQMAPEKAAAAVKAMTLGGKSTGDLKTLAQIRSATVKSGAWDEIASTLIRLGGQPVDSQGRNFNPQTFVQWYADMAPQARSLLFKPELRSSLEKFVAVNQRLAKVNALRNTSNTASGITATSTIAAMTAPLTVAATGNPMSALWMAVGEGAAAGANYGMAKAWTNPKFVQWATGYAKAVAQNNPNAVKSQVGRLTRLATTNPELRSTIDQMLRSFANDNNIGRVAASPDPNADQGNQQ